MSISYLALPAAVAFTLVAAFSSPTFARGDHRDVVTDNEGRTVLNTFGHCVRTDWVSGDNVCGARKAYVENTVVTSPAHGLDREARTVYFEFNKSRLMASESAKLDSLASTLKADTNVRSASIVGYADRIGSTNYNKHLSESRAKVVENYLHKHGYLNTSVAEVRWLGESEPVTNCPNTLSRPKLIACLQKDRRVEVEIEFNDTAADTHPHKTMDHNPIQ